MATVLCDCGLEYVLGGQEPDDSDRCIHDGCFKEELATPPGLRSLLRAGCLSRSCGDAVSSEDKSNVEFSGGTIAKVIFDIGDDAYVDVERHMVAAMAHD